VKWASKDGDNYRYFMVFDNVKLDGTKSIPEFIDMIAESYESVDS
jgi:type III restriction enzyme